MSYPEYQYEFAHALYRLLERFRYKAGWRFKVDDNSLVVTMRTPDSLTGRLGLIAHRVPLPSTTPSDEESYLQRWLLETIFKIERHEAMEFFTIDDAAPFFPEHGGNAYAVIEREEPVRVHRPKGEQIVQMMVNE